MGSVFARQPPDDAVGPERLYNRLQDVNSLTLVLDLRRTTDFVAAHVDGARRIDIRSARVQALVGELVDAAFCEIRGPFEFVVAFCCGQGKRASSSSAAVTGILAAHRWRENATVSGVWRFNFEEYHQQFPFACSDYSGFEESRLLPAAVSVNPRVYLSSWPLAEDPYIFGALRPTHIINCTPDLPNAFGAGGGDATYFRVPVKDDNTEELLAYLDKVVAFIDDATRNGGTILCHCQHGRSRSASVLAAWLIASHHWSVGDAVSYLKSCRPRVSPKHGLLRQLERWAPFRVTFGAPLEHDVLSMHPAAVPMRAAAAPLETAPCAAPIAGPEEQDDEFIPRKRTDLAILVQG